MKLTTLNFHEGELKFSAGHFTIFSATKRERLHGHNYRVEASVTAKVNDFGLAFDYRLLHQKLAALCKKINSYFLLPQHSPFMRIEEDEQYIYAYFNNEKIPFLKSDVLLLPITNTTLEDLSCWFVDECVKDQEFIKQHDIQAFWVRLYNGDEHSAEASWAWPK